MDRLEEIIEDYCKETGNLNFEGLCVNLWLLEASEVETKIEEVIRIVAKKYARECIEATIKKAYEGAKIEVSGMLTRSVSTEFYLYEKTSQTTFAERKVIVDKNSVISQFNYVLV
ncbi:hypothetical protein D3C87_1063020 [compost metagenome]